MKFNNYIIVILALLLCFTSKVVGQEKAKGEFSHKIVVGYHLGGTMPIPLPREVRKISSYWPQFTPQLGYNISYQAGERWSLESGITLDWKGMGARDEVKYMYTKVIYGGDEIQGYFTGKNETRVKIAYATLPVRIAYDLNPTWKIRGGAYVSYRSSAEFSGTVWDGYLRRVDDNINDIINSEKIDISNKNDATFDFGKEMRNFDMGVSLGFEHIFPGRFGIYGDLTYSLTPIFPSSFTGVDMKMRNIYFVIGASYRL